MIWTVTTSKFFYSLKTPIAKYEKAPIDTMYIIILASGTFGGVVIKDYVLYNKFINKKRLPGRLA